MGKEKISIVLGSLSLQSSDIHRFETLTKDYDVSFHLCDTYNQLTSIQSSARFFVYPDVPDMPGYLRGLDEQVQDSDLIVCLESTKLSSFQAMRIASRFNIPVLAFMDEYRPLFYAKWQNIRAIQSDILSHASFFMASSHAAKNLMLLEGVKEEKISVLQPEVDLEACKFSEAKRNKFRNYISVQPNQVLITVFATLHISSRLSDVFLAAKLLERKNPDAYSRTKWLVVGNGEEENSKALKMEAHNLGLGKKFMFLTQDSVPLMRDILSASDIFTSLKAMDPPFHEPFPYYLLEGIASGIMIVSSRGTAFSDFTGFDLQGSFELSSDSYDELVLGWEKALQNISVNFGPEFRKDRQEYNQEKLSTYYKNAYASLKSTIEKLVHYKNERQEAGGSKENSSKVEDVFLLVEELVRREDYVSAVETIDPYIECCTQDKMKSKLLGIRGDLQYKLGHFDRALDDLNLSIQLDAENFAAFRTLGYLSLQSHAHDEAVSFFKRVLSYEPSDNKAMMGVGIVYRKLGLDDESINWFEKALLQSPEDRKVKNNYTQACLGARNLNRAIESLDRMVDTFGEESFLIDTKNKLLAKMLLSAS